MKVTRRSFLGGSVALAAGAALGACGSDSGSGGSGSGGNIRLLGGGGTWVKGNFSANLIEKFNEGRSDGVVEVVSAGQKFGELFSSQVTAGTIPDLSFGGIGLATALENDWVQSLDDDLGVPIAERFPENMWVDGITTADGRIYSYTHSDGRGSFLQYNTDIMKAAGLNPKRPPATWDELIQMSRQVMDRVQGVSGLAAAFKVGDGYDYLPNSYTWKYPTVVTGFDYAEGRYSVEAFDAGIARLAQLLEAGILHPDVMSFDAASADAAFTNGNVCFAFTGSWACTVNNRADMTSYGLAYLPTEGAAAFFHGNLAKGQVWAAKESANPELLGELVDFMTSEETLSAMVAEEMRSAPDPELTIKSATVPQLAEMAEFQKTTVEPPVPAAVDVKALDVARAEQSLPAPRQDWWQIAQGVVAGKIDDWAGPLAEYETAMNERFDQALEEAGADRGLFTFGDWDGTTSHA